MQFEEKEKYSYFKIKVTLKYHVTKDQIVNKPDKTFDKLNEAIDYIRKVVKDYKKFPELGKPEIHLEKIKTSSVDYLVLYE